MTESGGPANQVGVRYQDEVAALYLGRMLDPRERPRRDRPTDVRVEAPEKIDDIVVQFADGSRRFIQVKRSLDAHGSAWKGLWTSFQRHLSGERRPEDRTELALGEPSGLASALRAIVERTEGSYSLEWRNRLTQSQRELVLSIAAAINGDEEAVWRIALHLDVTVHSAPDLTRDLAPLWMPVSSVGPARLFAILAGIAQKGAALRERFNAPTLYDRLRTDWDVVIDDAPSWGSERYRDAVAKRAVVELPGTDFRREVGENFLWPQSLRYDRDRRPDFDDDLPGWRDLGSSPVEDLRNFPSANLSAVVVIAGPGFGKTTLVDAIARRTAVAGLLPVVVPVTGLSESNLSITEYLAQKINHDFDVRIDWRAAADVGSMVLLLDGLDEVSGDRRTVVLRLLKTYCSAHPGVRWLMTVRDAAALAPPDGATTVELTQLCDKDVARYVEFYRPGEPELAAAVLGRVRSRPDLSRLVRIPIFLALMLVLRQEAADLSRSDLLEIYLEILFRPADFKPSELDMLDTLKLRRVTQRAAFQGLEAEGVGIGVRDLDRCSVEIDPISRTDEVREALVRRGVLRRTSPARFAFPFPIVQEYLAATELLESHSEELEIRLDMISRRPWAQAIQFALERHPNPAALVQQLLDREDDVFHTGLRLLGRCVANRMKVTNEQWHEIGSRLAAIWGRTSWRSTELVSGIIMDAFVEPLHPGIRDRLGDRWLLRSGADAVVARLGNDELSLNVLKRLLGGDIEHMMNLGQLQGEVDRLGTDAFRLYIERCLFNTSEEDQGAITALIGHMRAGGVDKDVAQAAFADTRLPLSVRLAAWRHTGQQLNTAAEQLILEALAQGGYRSLAAAADALRTDNDFQTIVRMLSSASVPPENALQVLDDLLATWLRGSRLERINAMLAEPKLPPKFRDRGLLFAVAAGRRDALDELLDRFRELDVAMVGAVVSLFGHVLERAPVERATYAIGHREWNPKDRLFLASSLAVGLTHKLEMYSPGSGSLISIPPHPGRTVPLDLLQRWLAFDGYSTHDRLGLILNLIRLGTLSLDADLADVLEKALTEPSEENTGNDQIVGHALEILTLRGKVFSIDKLEGIVRDSTYNIATTAVRAIAAGGTLAAANALIRLYGQVKKPILRNVIVGALEPLAGRLGLKVTRSGDALVSRAL